MLSFGNILERPIYKIWEETSKYFCTPGPACYANISNDVTLAFLGVFDLRIVHLFNHELHE